MTQHQFKVGQKVKVVRGFNEDPEAVDGNRNILAGHISEIFAVDDVGQETGFPTWIQVEYHSTLTDAQRRWFIRASCVVPLRKKVYV